MIHDAIARAICCYDKPCAKPDDCCAHTTAPVDIPRAVECVLKVVGDQLRARWEAEAMNVDKARWRAATLTKRRAFQTGGGGWIDER